MTITTYASFIAALGALSVSGVVRVLTAPPANVETADLPASFPRAMPNEEVPLTVQATGGWPVLRAELVVIVEPVGQSTTPTNHAACVTVIDGINAALRAGTATELSLGKAPLSWSINLTPNEFIGERQYWAVIATVEGRG